MTPMKIWYLYHDGFAVQAGGCLLVFDYWRDLETGNGRELKNGVFDPVVWLKDAVHQSHGGAIPPVIVFSSHKHGDHFIPEILTWQNTIPGIQYVLSHDIPKRHFTGIDKSAILEAGNPDKSAESALIVRMKPYQTHSWPELDMVVHTFKSTDAGVAFWVEIGGQVIYHAGDLNLWYWEEESKAWNNNMSARFKQEMQLASEWSTLTGKKPDLAFLPADPRLGSHWLDGFSYFLTHIGARHAFPMHFGDEHSSLENLPSELRTKMADETMRVLPHHAFDSDGTSESNETNVESPAIHLHLPKQRGELFILP